MATYISGETVHHLIKVRVGGSNATTNQVTNVSGALYVNGSLSGATQVSSSSLGSGIWRIYYTVPTGLNDGDELALLVDMTVSGTVRTVTFVDQVMARNTPAAIRNYLQANSIDVGLKTTATRDITVALATAGISGPAIADHVLRRGVTSAIVSGTLDRHSLGALVLMATNSDTTSNSGVITVRHPDTDASLFQYVITTGAGSPIQSVT